MAFIVVEANPEKIAETYLRLLFRHLLYNLRYNQTTPIVIEPKPGSG
jgi:hypothetical protein